MSALRRTGSADLPLHGGKAPPWLFERMSRLAPEVIEVLIVERGPSAVLERLADPHWFQAFGCLLGFDWHSSGVTTTVCGALKVGLAERGTELGIQVAGGKGGTSRSAPEEIARHADRFGLDPAPFVHASRMSAKVDSAAVQDGFQIYHHAFFLTSTGGWTVVQQGMREADGYARRYHWLAERVSDFVCEPHAAICADRTEDGVLNLTALEGDGSRRASVELARAEPERILREAKQLAETLASRTAPAPAAAPESATSSASSAVPSAMESHSSSAATSVTRGLPLFDGDAARHSANAVAAGASHAHHTTARGPAARSYRMPRRHWVDPARDVLPRNLSKVLLTTWEAAPRDFAALLAVPGVGARSLRALALLAEVLYGEPASFRDPARFSFAHGGKDGHPFPVDRETYDGSIDWLREAVARARIGHSDRLRALQRLKDYDGSAR